jgi:hypothetical protein
MAHGHREIGSPMKRYYFDIRDRDGLVPDEVGLNLRNLQAAQEEAALSLADMARDVVLDPKDSIHPMSIEVRDGDGPIFTVTFLYESKGSS